MGLPRSKGKDVIFVIIDMLTKYNTFLAPNHPYSPAIVSQVFFDHIYKHHDLPSNIVSNRDIIFISSLWSELLKQMGITQCLSSLYHPQKDGQIEVVNQCLESYLRCMVRENPRPRANGYPLLNGGTTRHTILL